MDIYRPLSYSRISCFLACQHKYKLQYVHDLTPVYHIPRMTRGKLVDKGIEAAILCQDRHKIPVVCQETSTIHIEHEKDRWLALPSVKSYLDMSGSKARDEYIETVEESKAIALRVCKFLKLGEGKWETMKIPHHKTGKPTLAVQVKVRADLVNWQSGFEGWVDWIARDTESGRVLLIDFKCRDQLQPEESMQFDYQLPAYHWCVESDPRINFEIDGCAHLQMRAKVPSTPKQLKPTKKVPLALSKAACATDLYTYFAEVIRLGLKPTDYAEMYAKLTDFDVITELYRSKEERRNIWGEVENAAANIAAYHHLKYPSPRRLHTMQCRFCNMDKICLADLRGHDTDDIIKYNYKKRESK